MKNFTKAIMMFILFATNSAFAQRAMKDPVSFKLKNGLTVIVAQNAGLGKIYSRLTIENATDENDRVVAQVLENYFNSKANKFNETVTQNAEGNEIAKVTMSFKELNTATDIANFEQALNYVSLAINNPKISTAVLEEMKAQYTGDKQDLKSISLLDVQNFYQKNYNAKDSFLTIAGDITPAVAKVLANKTFGNWTNEPILSK